MNNMVQCMPFVAFDTLVYANRLKSVGLDAKVAEMHAELQANVLTELTTNQLVTKQDLKEIYSAINAVKTEIYTAINDVKMDLLQLRSEVKNEFAACAAKEELHQLQAEVKNCATKDDLLKLRSEIKDDLKGVRDDITGVKDDLKRVRDDITGVKDDLKRVKDDLKAFATKDDIKDFVTKHELHEKLEKLKYDLLLKLGGVVIGSVTTLGVFLAVLLRIH